MKIIQQSINSHQTGLVLKTLDKHKAGRRAFNEGRGRLAAHVTTVNTNKQQ